MSHLPNWQEYGKPTADSGGAKNVTQIHDAIYGKYEHQLSYHQPPAGGANPSVQFDPKPFVLK